MKLMFWLQTSFLNLIFTQILLIPPLSLQFSSFLIFTMQIIAGFCATTETIKPQDQCLSETSIKRADGTINSDL